MSKLFQLTCVLLALTTLPRAIVLAADNASTTPGSKILQIVQKHQAVINAPPKLVPTQGMPDGPLMGNGDVGVVAAGPANEQVYCIGKNDFWNRTPHRALILAVGAVRLSIPSLAGASYRQVQRMDIGEVQGEFAVGNVSLQTRTWVQADENLLITLLTNKGTEPITVSVHQTCGPVPLLVDSNKGKRKLKTDVEGMVNSAVHADAKAGTLDFSRKGDSLPGQCREVAVATRIVGVESHEAANASDPGLEFTIKPAETAALATVVLSDLDAKNFAEAAKQRVAALQMADFRYLSVRHHVWWEAFWGRSFLEIPDKKIEQHWYAAQYVMGCCSRPGKVAPGLWGNWITTDFPCWRGDFHLNYNFQAPFYIVYSSNHAELSLPVYQAVSEWLPNARETAKRRGWKGVHFPVGIGPWGLMPMPREKDWGQRSNAAYLALNYIWHYQYTQDVDFLRKTLYPYLLEVADFWEDYLKFENGRYIIYNDSIHEGSGSNMNGVLSLGLVRTLFTNLLSMSKDLGVDENRREKWEHILSHLSDYPLQERNGKKIFRYTERGMSWCRDNTLGIQHIYPGCAIGLGSDPKLLEISRDMIEAMSRWDDNNGFSSWYTACARVGCDPTLMLKNLRKVCDKRSMPNLIITYGGGGIENVSGFLCLNEMMLQSYEGVLRFFPCWPKDQDARFGTLRAVGAFLVSAEIKNGLVGDVKIVSERGRECNVQNPWPGKSVVLIRNGVKSETLSGDRVKFKTLPGEAIGLKPQE